MIDIRDRATAIQASVPATSAEISWLSEVIEVESGVIAPNFAET